jgi:thiol:disulfide interchange protein DsbA
MALQRRLLLGAALGCSAWLAGCASSSLVEGRDYLRLEPPQPVPAGAAVEVIEFFWFGCPHCADMHPRLQAWLRSKPADVSMRYQPAVFKESWADGARLHHTLAALGELESRAGAVFDAVQLEELQLGNFGSVRAWVQRQGLDEERFRAAWQSPAVLALTARAADAASGYALRGVPAFVVDGRYLVSNGLSGSAAATLATLDRLIVKARQQRAAASGSRNVRPPG